MMKKRNGFSIIELLITIALMGILLAITLPNFSKIRSINAFRTESDHILDILLESRMNALSGKQCSENAGESWIFQLNLTGVNLQCEYLDEEDPPELQTTEVKSREFAPEILIIRIEFDNDPDESGNIVTLKFFPDSSDSKIIHEGVSKNDVRIVLSHPTSDESRTICFNRIAGFPKQLEGDVACPQ